MLSFINPKDGPVIDGQEHRETVYAKDQPQYLPLRTIVSDDTSRGVLSRWNPTPEQRKAIAEGADIYLQLRTYGQPLQPILMMVSDGSWEDWEKLQIGICAEISNG